MANVRPPPARPMPLSKLLVNGDIDLEILKAYLIESGTISLELIRYLLTKVTQICRSEPNLVKVNGDVVIIGDIHGQFMDMMGMF